MTPQPHESYLPESVVDAVKALHAAHGALYSALGETDGFRWEPAADALASVERALTALDSYGVQVVTA